MTDEPSTVAIEVLAGGIAGSIGADLAFDAFFDDN